MVQVRTQYLERFAIDPFVGINEGVFLLPRNETQSRRI